MTCRSLLTRAPAVAFLAALLPPMLVLGGCAVNPVTGKTQLALVSESQEIEMGRQGDQETQATYGLYDDPALAAHVEQIGQKLARVTERPNLEWHFHVLDSPVVNAFALPGGYIYITRGILATLNSDAQLAGVLGHECGHVAARHSVQQISQSQIAGLGLGLGMVLIPGASRFGNLASGGLQLLFLKYSRDDENQADQLGVKYATLAGYDPREIPKTYVMLQQMEQTSGSTLPNFLSTHPDPGDRIQRTTQEADAALQGHSGALAIQASEYKRLLDGLVYGNDPRQGYLEGSRFYAPELRFQMDFPSGWKVDNGHTAVTAGPSSGQSGMQLTIVKSTSVTAPDQYVTVLEQGGKLSQPSGRTENIGGHSAWLGTALVSDGQGGTQTLALAWVTRQPGEFYQFAGGPGDDAGLRNVFSSSVESMRDLTDPAKINVRPTRVVVRSAPGSESVVTLVQGTSGAATDANTVAWLNGLAPTATPARGFLVKVPVKGQ